MSLRIAPDFSDTWACSLRLPPALLFQGYLQTSDPHFIRLLPLDTAKLITEAVYPSSRSEKRL
jgi:hypothetical protein